MSFYNLFERASPSPVPFVLYVTNGSKIVLTISSEIPHPLSVQEITIESDIFSAQRKIDPFESVKVFSETASFAFCRRFKIN